MSNTESPTRQVTAKDGERVLSPLCIRCCGCAPHLKGWASSYRQCIFYSHTQRLPGFFRAGRDGAQVPL